MRWLVKYNTKEKPDTYREVVMEATTQASCCQKFVKEYPNSYIKGFPRPIGGSDPRDIDKPPQ